MKMSDAIIGIIFTVAGLAVIIEARTFPAVAGQAYGSSFFPTILGAAMILCGLALAVTAIIKGAASPLFRLPSWLQSTRSKLSLLIVVLALIFYMLAAGYLGFCLTAFLIVTGLQVWMKERLLRSFMTALGVTAVFFVVFGSVLRVPLPYGLVESLLP